MPNLNQYKLPCPSLMSTFTSVCSEDYLAISLTERGNVVFWKTENPCEQPVTLIGHYKTVKTLCLSHAPDSYYLCSSSSDNIILWNLTHNGGNPTRGRVLHSNMEQPLFSQFSGDNSKIAFSFSNGIWIFDLKGNQWAASTEKIHLSLFVFKNYEILGSDDNFLKVWNFKTNEIVPKVSIALGFPCALCIYKQSEVVVVGSTCGQLLVYGENFRLLKSSQVWKLIMQYRQSDQCEEGFQAESDSFPIYSLEVLSFEEDDHFNGSLQNGLYALVVTSSCLLLVNLCNEEIVFFKSFNDDGTYEKEENIGIIRSASTSLNYDKSVAHICLTPVFGESLVFLKFPVKEIIRSKEIVQRWTRNDNIELALYEPCFTFLKSDQSSESLLNHKSVTASKSKSAEKVNSKNNLPVTFHSKVKSSGYGKKSRSTTMFHPQINKVQKSKSLTSLKDLKIEPATKKSSFLKLNEKPANYKTLILQGKTRSFEDPTPSSLHVTANGQYATCTSSGVSVDILKIGKKNVKIAYTLNAHNGKVNSAKWSHSGKLIVTAGGDKTTKIWSSEKKLPLLIIGKKNEDGSLDLKNKFTFEDPVERAQFYYLDRFILTASGNEVCLLDYSINIEKTGIKNFINKSRIKLIKKIMMDTKRITAIAAMNQFFSNLVISSGSSKCLNIIDMAVGKVQCHIDDPSSRSPHLISLNEGSPSTSLVPAMYDVFLSAYQFDGIKIWDLRTKKYVLNYKEHKCRSLDCEAVFSPCGRYIATGSEDKSVYIYDLRQLPAMCKLTDPHIDAFTSVSFLPTSQLLASSLNGLISLYGDIA